MAIDRVPALKRCRSLGIEPGVVGLGKSSKRQPRRTRGKVSEYGMQLKEKQKAKFIYGVLEKQFRAYYAKAKKMPGIAGDNLISLLERRLDNVVFRLGLADPYDDGDRDSSRSQRVALYSGTAHDASHPLR